MASGTHGHAMEIKNPGTLQGVGTLRTVTIVLAVLGFAAFAAGLKADSSRAWATFVINHFFFMSLALGGVIFACFQWISGAMWSAPVRRLAESLTGYLPFVFVTMIVLFFGIHSLYHWSHPEVVKGDILLEGKAGYLNIPFFVIRGLVSLAVWGLFAKMLIGNSLKQDTTRSMNETRANQRITPPFLILFAITFTMTAFDHLMSLDPHWFSTMFGVYCFAGLLYSTFALVTAMAIWLRRRGLLEGIVNDNHLHDLGKFMFAFTVFWAYIGFCQFMLIWYANLPEETGYFLRRMTPGWLPVSIFLIVGKFAAPFMLLIRRGNKRSETRLFWVALYMLVCQWIDMLWLVQPEFFKAGPKFGWIEIGTTLGFIGVFGFLVLRFLSRNNVVAIGDPRLAESVHHHHQ